MSFEEFLTQLKATLSKPDYTPVIQHEMICARDERGYIYCPITIVVWDRLGVYIDPEKWYDAAILLGIDHMLANEIVCAADFEDHPLRSKLVGAVFGA